MSKMKMKTDKRSDFFFDAEHGLVCNGHWAMVYNPLKFDPPNKVIEGAMAAGKSFSVRNGQIDFDEKIPNIEEIMRKRWEENKGNYETAEKTGWSYNSREYGKPVFSREYKSSSGKYVYILGEYAQMIDALDAPLFVSKTDTGNLATYCVEDGCALGVFMPRKGPEEGRG
jgi:hypothetical protein